MMVKAPIVAWPHKSTSSFGVKYSRRKSAIFESEIKAVSANPSSLAMAIFWVLVKGCVIKTTPALLPPSWFLLNALATYAVIFIGTPTF